MIVLKVLQLIVLELAVGAFAVSATWAAASAFIWVADLRI